MGRNSVDIGGDHVGLDLIDGHLVRGLGMENRIQEIQETSRLVPLSGLGQGPDHPAGGVGVLAAVLADTSHVTLDVTGIPGRIDKRGRQEFDEAGIFDDQAPSSRAASAWSARSGGATSESTAQAWARASIRHSLF